MKQSHAKNNWTVETYWLFFDGGYSDCWMCGQNHSDCGHHIFGRGQEEGCEKSPLNFAPLSNHFCHLPNHGYLTSDEGKRKMFTRTLIYLMGIGYTLNKQDEQFLEKYKDEINRLNIKL